MAKAKFGIGDIIDIRGQKVGTAGQAGVAKLTETAGDAGCQEYREIWLNPRDVKPSESNFYSQENIEELADSFLTVGQQQPTVLAKINGEYRIVSGHRRNLANIKNLERGYKEYEKVRYLYKEMTPAMLELSLLMGNACNRELTPWEKTQQAQRLKEALLRAKKEDGLAIQGKLRDIIADLMHESSSNIAKMNSIRKNAAPEIREEFRKGSLGISAAYEASKLSPAEQKVIADKTAKGETVPVKEIAGQVGKKNGSIGRQKVFHSNTLPQTIRTEDVPGMAETGGRVQDGERVGRKNSGIVKMSDGRQEKSEQRGKTAESELADGAGRAEESGKKNGGRNDEPHRVNETGQCWDKEADLHRERLARWKEQDAELIQKVFDSNTLEMEWTDTDWIEFTAKVIMERAEDVSREDLYLLHGILVRCRKSVRFEHF